MQMTQQQFSEFIRAQLDSTMVSYGARPNLIRENAGQEQAIIQGGYGRKQVQELVQNAVDAVREAGHRVEVHVTDDALYVANDGSPFTQAGITTLLHSNMSDKRDDQIGRFGLGFKSVLQVSGNPQIFSDGHAFQFDAQRSRDLLRPLHPGLTYYPILRLPFELDEVAAREADRLLDELRGWATTVIRLPFSRPDDAQIVIDQAADFPFRFLLFSPHLEVFGVALPGESRPTRWTVRRDWASKNSSIVALESGDIHEEWHVFTREHVPSNAAASAAGDLHARERMDVSWAVPSGASKYGVKADLGAWNYFPTKLKLPIAGIVNAPFKMNDDRVSVLEDAYNQEILAESLTRLVLDSLDVLPTKADPGAHLDFMPTRPKEQSLWMRAALVDPVTTAVSKVPAVPDLTGALQRIDDLNVRPGWSDPDRQLIGAWTEAARSVGVTDWAHESALSKIATSDRGAFINRLLEAHRVQRRSSTEWVEGIAAPAAAEAFAAAIEFAAPVIHRDMSDAEWMEVGQKARIVLMSDGSTAPLIGPSLYLPNDPGQDEPGVVDFELTEFKGVAETLRSFGAKTLEGINRLSQSLNEALAHPEDEERALIAWRTAERYPQHESITLLTNSDAQRRLLARTSSGAWKPWGELWRAGRMLRHERPEDAEVLVAPEHPFLTPEVCENLGIPATLPAREQTSSGPAFLDWKSKLEAEAGRQVRDAVGPGALARVDVPSSIVATPRLHQLSGVSRDARASATAALLRAPQPRLTVTATAELSDRSGVSHSRSVPVTFHGPDVEWVRRSGLLPTHYGDLPLTMCTPAMGSIPYGLLPAPTIDLDPEVEAQLGLRAPSTSAQWRTLFEAASLALAAPQLAQLYGHVAAHGVPAPELIWTRPANSAPVAVPFRDVRIAGNEETAAHVLEHGGPPLLSTGTAALDAALESNWGIPPLTIAFDSVIEYEPSIRQSEQLTVSERFPYLSRVLGRKMSGLKKAELIPCRSMELVTTNDFDDAEDRDCTISFMVFVDELTIYYRDTFRDEGLLGQIARHVGSSDSGADVERRMRELKLDSERDDLWRKLTKLRTDRERVILLLGSDGLREIVPTTAVELLEAEGHVVTDKVLYSLAQDVHGTGLWQVILRSLPDEDASGFLKDANRLELKDLGFGDDMFRTTVKAKPAREEYLAPVGLSPLHDYQESTAAQILDTLAAAPGANKAVVQLPTGAGKTRVAVESLLRHVRRGSAQHDLIVWIAQSEELCEQAVQAWGSAWTSMGIGGQRMAVSRLWGGRKVAAEPDTRLHVVVATIQTLVKIAQADPDSPRAQEHDWLKKPEVVVVDEAHTAIAPSYTTVLRWFGRSTTQQGKPLLGLSATPFRGTSTEQTERLVKRFGTTLIQPAQFTAADAHAYLQDMGVLAKVTHETLKGTTLRQRHERAQPNEDELDENSAMLEQRIDLDSVAQDSDRNREIIRHLEARKDKIAHAIVFAASVEHAQALSAVLKAKGISAAAIHGGTDLSRRRALIQDFRDGDLQVLTNFDVLSQGFDAPKVDAVYLCRPTFSPNKYIQMVGRGLRGPKNGGSEEVLLVNVEDNLENFGAALAYTDFEYLWEAQDA